MPIFGAGLFLSSLPAAPKADETRRFAFDADAIGTVSRTTLSIRHEGSERRGDTIGWCSRPGEFEDIDGLNLEAGRPAGASSGSPGRGFSNGSRPFEVVISSSKAEYVGRIAA